MLHLLDLSCFILRLHLFCWILFNWNTNHFMRKSQESFAKTYAILRSCSCLNRWRNGRVSPICNWGFLHYSWRKNSERFFAYWHFFKYDYLLMNCDLQDSCTFWILLVNMCNSLADDCFYWCGPLGRSLRWREHPRLFPSFALRPRRWDYCNFKATHTIQLQL